MVDNSQQYSYPEFMQSEHENFNLFMLLRFL